MSTIKIKKIFGFEVNTNHVFHQNHALKLMNMYSLL